LTHFKANTDTVIQHKGFQGQILVIIGVTSDPVGEHEQRQASLGTRSSQETSELLSEDAPLSSNSSWIQGQLSSNLKHLG